MQCVKCKKEISDTPFNYKGNFPNCKDCRRNTQKKKHKSTINRKFLHSPIYQKKYYTCKYCDVSELSSSDMKLNYNLCNKCYKIYEGIMENDPEYVHPNLRIIVKFDVKIPDHDDCDGYCSDDPGEDKYRKDTFEYDGPLIKNFSSDNVDVNGSLKNFNDKKLVFYKLKFLNSKKYLNSGCYSRCDMKTIYFLESATIYHIKYNIRDMLKN